MALHARQIELLFSWLKYSLKRRVGINGANLVHAVLSSASTHQRGSAYHSSDSCATHSAGKPATGLRKALDAALRLHVKQLRIAEQA
jgi:hypothetical protein